MENKYRRTDTTEVKRVKTSFNIRDEKGRVLGFVITVSRCTWEEVTNSWGYFDNPNFIAHTSVTRNGNSFGKSVNEVHGNTEAEAMAKAITRRENALKRYAKKFG